MNPLKPVKTIIEAITFPFQAIFVVGICFIINWMTSPGHWWVQWVAFGMGIALLSKWAKALKTIVGAAVVGGVGYAVYRWFQNRQNKPSAESAVNSASAANTVSSN
jgi:membrane protein implicated in regulation of membrane protease activity